MLTLILGGARSGKSGYAQSLLLPQPRVAFIATAQACDDEMRLRIRRHQAARPARFSSIV
jgi:adenosyl cobinamide kinase/adenosyl cobinamide phosphate guanylyltransferase